ncbi:MAG: type II toxin-antitoxin system RelE/ParE family toxin [Spirochaetota bacterium]
MKYDLVIRPEAESEMTDAYEWYELRAVGLGNQFLLSVDAVLQAVTRNPYQYPEIFKSIRRGLVHRFPYAILFIVHEGQIAVLAVFHAKRDPTQWEKRHS